MSTLKINEWKYLTSSSYRKELEAKRQRIIKRREKEKKRLSPFLEYEDSPKSGLMAWFKASVKLQQAQKPLPTRKEILKNWCFYAFVILLLIVMTPIALLKK